MARIIGQLQTETLPTVAVIYLATEAGVTFAADDWRQWLAYVLEWTMFQSGVVIGWWFAVRNSQVPRLGK